MSDSNYYSFNYITHFAFCTYIFAKNTICRYLQILSRFLYTAVSQKCFGSCPINIQTKYKQQILSAFFEYGKLTHLPSQLKKREIICEHITNAFDCGRDYTEPEVNDTITHFHDDYCTIRRELVAVGFLERKNGIYRRVK